MTKRRRFSEQPPGTAESTQNLEAALEEARRAKAQLAEAQAELAEAQRIKFRMLEEQAEVQAELAEAQRVKFQMLEEQGQLQAQLEAVQAQLAEAKAYIAELKRQLFGSKGEPLSAEQEAQLEQLADDAQEQAKSPAPDSLAVLEEEEQAKKERRKSKRPSRHPLPATMETETVTLEPENTLPAPRHQPVTSTVQAALAPSVLPQVELGATAKTGLAEMLLAGVTLIETSVATPVPLSDTLCNLHRPLSILRHWTGAGQCSRGFDVPQRSPTSKQPVYADA